MGLREKSVMGGEGGDLFSPLQSEDPRGHLGGQ